MKKYFYLALALCMGFAATSCDEEDGPGGPIIDTVVHTVTFEGDYWSALIDSKHYGGELLYGENANNYAWTDSVTGLNGGMTLEHGGAWGGGFYEGGTAISNYIDGNIEEHATFEYQLAVPARNMKDYTPDPDTDDFIPNMNFVVANCPAVIKFPEEGVSRIIYSMDIIPTTFLLGTMLNGNDFAQSLKDGGYLTLIIAADNGMAIMVDLARDGKIMQDWTTIDLSSLGKVNSLTFEMDGSDKSEYGLNHPMYFAFDNVVVEMKR